MPFRLGFLQEFPQPVDVGLDGNRKPGAIAAQLFAVEQPTRPRQQPHPLTLRLGLLRRGAAHERQQQKACSKQASSQHCGSGRLGMSNQLARRLRPLFGARAAIRRRERPLHLRCSPNAKGPERRWTLQRLDQQIASIVASGGRDGPRRCIRTRGPSCRNARACPWPAPSWHNAARTGAAPRTPSLRWTGARPLRLDGHRQRA